MYQKSQKSYPLFNHDNSITEESGNKRLPAIIKFHNSMKDGLHFIYLFIYLDKLSPNVARASLLTSMFSPLDTAEFIAEVTYKSTTRYFNLTGCVIAKNYSLRA